MDVNALKTRMGGMEAAADVAQDATPASASSSGHVSPDEHALTNGRRRRAKKVKYVDEDEEQLSEEEEAERANKRQRARQLDCQTQSDTDQPILDHFVGRRVNAKSGMVEYLCKFVGRSYLHLWWLTFDEIYPFKTDDYRMHDPVLVYDRKLKRDGYQDLDDVDDLEANKITVEKILNHKTAPTDDLDDQIESARQSLPFPQPYPRVTDYFLLEHADAVAERMNGIVKKLMNENGGDIFQHPVDTEDVPDYLNIINNPMDLGTIQNRLARESYYVGPAGVSLFASNVRLVFENCKTYNQEGSAIWNIADEILKTFEKWLYEWLLSPSAWMRLASTGDVEEDEKLEKKFDKAAKKSYASWLPWELGCSVCESNGDSEHLLLCDRCDGEVHMHCCSPKVTELPDGDWLCFYCQKRQQFESEVKQLQATIKQTEEPVDGSEETIQTRSTTPKSPTTRLQSIPRIVNQPLEDDRKVNRNTSNSIKPTKAPASTHKSHGTLFLVKWVGLSVRFSTWEKPEDIGDDEQIQRYFKFSRVPTQKEIQETTCQLPCCSQRNQFFLNSTLNTQRCDKDRFCTLGFKHEGACSRNVNKAQNAYGSAGYRKTRMVEQVKAQLFAFHSLLNNHAPDKSVLKQCGVHTSAYVAKKQFLTPASGHGKAVTKEGDEDYSVSDDSESSDDEEELGDVEEDLGLSRAALLYDTVETEAEATEEVSFKNVTDEVSEVMSAMVEHVAIGYPTELKKAASRVAFTCRYTPSAMRHLPTFTEYSVALRRTPFGLGMRLGVSENGGFATVLGFQRLNNGMLGPAEACGVITLNDVLVAVNQTPVTGMAFSDIVKLINASTDFVHFCFHSQQPAHAYPLVCNPRQVQRIIAPGAEHAAGPSEYLPYSYNSYHKLLKIGSEEVNVPSTLASTFVTPTGPMGHLYAGIIDNSIDPHEHFASFLPEKKRPAATTDKSKDSKKDEFIPYEQSPTFKGGRTLRSYQVEGMNWIISCFKAQRSCILADEMGLGKTVQVVSVLDHLRTEESIRGPYLIVVPLSTIQHWRREIESWTDLNVCVYHDIGDRGGSRYTAKDMRAVIREQEWYYPQLGNSIFRFNVLLTTYETVSADIDELEHIHWRLLVVDEAHRLKNSGSRVLKQMRVLNCDRKLLLTGTPLQNNTQELWVLLNFLEPVKFNDMEAFNEKFGQLRSQEQVMALQKIISPYIMRRVKEDVEKSIPPKEETIVSVELTTLQKQYYRAIYDKNKSFLYRGTKNGLPTLNNIQLQLRKCCNHPFLIKGVEDREVEELGPHFERDKVIEKTVSCSGKMVFISKLLPKLQREGHKVLIFSQFLKQLDLLERYCDFHNFGYERLDGSTGGSLRQNAIDRFSRPNSKSFVFLLSTKAGGVGINLIAADTVIIFDSDWNPQNDLQAQSRAHRIGQKKSVQIYRLVTRNTYESEMFDRASRKLGLEHAILGTTSFSETAPMEKPSAEQLVELLKRGAYALMEDEDDSASKAFAERDIETILKEHTVVRVVKQGKTEEEGESSDSEGPAQSPGRKKKVRSLGGLAVDRSSFVAEGSTGELSVDDPNFWEKVLPGAVSFEMLNLKLEDGSAVSSRQAKIKFMNNLEIALDGLVEDMQTSQSEDVRFGVNLEHEFDMAFQVLQTMTAKYREDFSEDQLDIARDKMAQLEQTRRRNRRAAAGPQVQVDAEEASPPRRRRRRGNKTANDDSEDSDAHKRRKVAKTHKKSSRRKKVPERAIPNSFQPQSSSFNGSVINSSDDLCTLCGDGGFIILCDGPCHRSFHLECVGMKSEPEDENWLCPDCAAGRHMCLVCKQVGEMGTEFGVIQCAVAKCGRFYHKGCIAEHPRVEWVGKQRFRCPSHFCHGCPPAEAVAKSKKKGRRKKNEAVVRCIHCEQAYHTSCIKSTDQFMRLSTNLMICASHLEGKRAPARAEKITPAKPSTRAERRKKSGGKSAPLKASKRKRNESVSNAQEEEVDSDAVEKKKECAFCHRGDVGPVQDEKNKLDGQAPEGPFLDAPVRFQRLDKTSENVYVHMNCALQSPEVYVKEDGQFCNLQAAIRRGRQMKCSLCKRFGATVGCVVESCRCNFHLRCALKSGGGYVDSAYSFYCKTHAAEKRTESPTYCICGATEEDDDDLRLKCSTCGSRFHPRCLNMSDRQAGIFMKDEDWVCFSCGDVKMAQSHGVKTLEDEGAEQEEKEKPARRKRASGRKGKLTMRKRAKPSKEASPVDETAQDDGESDFGSEST